MSRRPLPDWLHPSTLRFVAYEEACRADAYERDATYFESRGMPVVVSRMRGRARDHRMRAKRLRGIATRIERRRERGS